jgi:hypothetical protein
MADAAQGIKLMFMVGSATGAGWLLAILVLFQVGGAGMQYAFTVANAFQGCLIFTCHVLLKEEGRLVFLTMKQTLASITSGSRSSRSKRNKMTRGGQQQSQPSSARGPTCAWRPNVGGIRSSNDMLATCSVVSVSDGHGRFTNYTDTRSGGDLNKTDSVVYDAAKCATLTRAQCADARASSVRWSLNDSPENSRPGAVQFDDDLSGDSDDAQCPSSPREVPRRASTFYSSHMADARKSSAGYIDLEAKAPDPSPIRRSNSYSNAVLNASSQDVPTCLSATTKLR